MRHLAKAINFKQPAPSEPPRALWPFLGWSVFGSRKYIALGAILSGFSGFLDMAASVVLGWVIDATVTADRTSFVIDNLTMLIAGIVFFLIIRPLAFGASTLVQSYIIQPNLLNMVLLRLHRWTLGHSITFFDNDFAGRISQKELQTAGAVTNVVIEFLHAIIFALASVLGAIWIVASLGWVPVVIFIAWLVIYVSVIQYFIPKVRAKSTHYAAARSNVVGQVVDVIANVKTVKLFANTSFEDDAVMSSMDSYLEKSLDRASIIVRFRIILMIMAGLMPVALLGHAIAGWVAGTVSLGEITVAGALGLRLAQMTGWVSFTLMGIYANLGEVEDGIQALTPAHDLVDTPNATNLCVDKPTIEFNNVSFQYGDENGGIRDVSLTVQAGEKIGIVGASGAGKSTLVNLILRLYDPEQGEIRISGQNIAHVKQDSLRRAIGIVSQETAMFNRSAYDNIAYGRPETEPVQVENAAKQAQAHDFIKMLTDPKGRVGYQAHLGERGVKLSGGQRQRVAIARTILKDAPILILDEATSALDSEVEAAIQSSLETLMQGKTVLAIAHRLSTISRMDRIIVMQQGQIVEDGTHDELLAQNGLYARYWKRQSGGFIGH